MKRVIFAVPLVASLLLAGSAAGQGTFIYDQQSSTESHFLDGLAGFYQQPLGQAFTPTLSSVGFIRLWVSGVVGDLAVNVRSRSITGPIVATSGVNSFRGGFGTFTDFIFTNGVAVTPGTTYYLQPYAVLGGASTSAAYYLYPGPFYIDGVAQPSGANLWFREGIIVPEPTALALIVVAAGLLRLRRKA